MKFVRRRLETTSVERCCTVFLLGYTSYVVYRFK